MKEVRPSVRVVSTGRHLPSKVLTNQDLEKMVDTSDEWILTRTGIRERRIAGDGVTVTQMGVSAARTAMERAGVEPGQIDAIIVSTATPDRWLPSTACDIQACLGASNAMAFDLMAACSGFLYALTVAEGYLTAGRGETVLLIATEMMSRIIDWEDRATCVLFGDGAGAAVVQRSDDERGILSSHHKSDGALANLLYRPAGGVAQPLDEEGLREGRHLMFMAGREVFKNAVRSMAEAAQCSLRDAGLTSEQIDLLIPHQANRRIIEATARYTGMPMERVFVNLDRYGNISSATIPVALDEAQEQGLLKPGDRILMTAFGAGLTWGAVTMRW